VLKLIESVFSVPPVAARETSSDVGNLLEVLESNHQPLVPALPDPGYVIPSSLCLSSIGGPLEGPLRSDDEPTTFQRMLESDLVKNFLARL